MYYVSPRMLNRIHNQPKQEVVSPNNDAQQSINTQNYDVKMDYTAMRTIFLWSSGYKPIGPIKLIETYSIYRMPLKT